MKSKLPLIISSSVLVISLLVTGITVSKLKVNETTTGAPVSAAEIATPNPNKETITGDLIAGFPEVAVYPDAILIQSSREVKENSSSVDYSGEWKIGGDNLVSEVASWYKYSLANSGWNLSVEENSDPNTFVVDFNREGETLKLNVVKGRSTNKHSIDIIIEISSEQ